MPFVDFANGPGQRKVAELLDQGVTTAAEIGRILNLNDSVARRHVRTVKARAGQKDRKEHIDATPEAFNISRTTSLYDPDGNLKLQWVQQREDKQKQLELMQEAISALSEDLPKLPATLKPADSQFDDDLLAVYPLGDPHIGVLTWAEETGQDWDLKIAEEKFCNVFHRLVLTAPQCEQAVIVNLGDFFHSDNMEGVTSRSGHHLDMDGRFAKMIRVGFKIMRQMIDSALSHHKTVKVINATGNHDDTSSLFLSVALANMYEDEPRVTVDDSPTPFHYVEWGQCMFGVHHGHSCKPAMLPGVMAADQPEMWGRTTYRYWYTGHIHHDTKKEYAGVTQESFRTLAAKDAYATWGGYRSGQDSKCIVLHKDFGEVERHTVNLAMV